MSNPQQGNDLGGWTTKDQQQEPVLPWVSLVRRAVCVWRTNRLQLCAECREPTRRVAVFGPGGLHTEWRCPTCEPFYFAHLRS